MGVYKMWVFLAEFAKVYFADIFEFGAVEEEVLLGLYSSFFTLLAQPLLFGQPRFLMAACFYGQAVSAQSVLC